MSVDTAHSIYGASAAHRWVECPASIRAISEARSSGEVVEGENLAADEGTLAHELAEFLLRNPEQPHSDLDEMNVIDWVINIVKENPVWQEKYRDLFDFNEMLKIGLRYREYCREPMGKMTEQYTERKVHMPRVHEMAFGTNDHAVVNLGKKHAIITDLKYGRGVRVDVKYNPQVLMYAEGVRQMIFDETGVELQTFTGRIFQPRHKDGENIESWDFTIDDVNEFVGMAAESARLSEESDPPFVPGQKQCSFCDVKGSCPALAKYVNDSIMDSFDDLETTVDERKVNLKKPLLTTDAELAEWLGKGELIKGWVDAVATEAHNRAMNGATIPGYKLVLGRSSYVADEESLLFVLGDSALKEPTLKSKTDIEKMVGSKKFKTSIALFYRKVDGKPKLAPASSKQPEYSPDESMRGSFDELQ